MDSRFHGNDSFYFLNLVLKALIDIDGDSDQAWIIGDMISAEQAACSARIGFMWADIWREPRRTGEDKLSK